MEGKKTLPSILYPSPRQAQMALWDCACALDLPLWPQQWQAGEAWVRRSSLLRLPVNGGWQACYNPSGPVGVVVLNQAAQRILSAFDVPHKSRAIFDQFPQVPPQVLEDSVMHLAQTGLLRPAAQESAAAPRPSTLSSWLHLTEACNLDCPYCYVKKCPEAMSVDVGSEAIDRLLGTALQHRYSRLLIKYAGGEPFLSFRMLRALHAYAADRADEAGLELEEVILSNGVGVTDAMLDFVARAGMRLMVSLDGGPDSHDRVRARRDGASTYASVTDTVERALARGLRPNISITLTALNLDGAVEAVAFALERGLPFNLNFFRARAVGEQDAALVPEPGRLIVTMRQVLDLIRLFPSYPFPLTGILDRVRLDAPHDSPCSAGRDYMVVGPQGQISACQMLLDEPWSGLDDRDPLGTIRQRGEGILTGDVEVDCQSCEWRQACGGGCPLMRGTALHEQYCEVYRALMPDLIRLEASRLLGSQVPMRQ